MHIFITFTYGIHVYCHSEKPLHPLPYPQVLSRFHSHHYGHDTLRRHLFPHMVRTRPTIDDACSVLRSVIMSRLFITGFNTLLNHNEGTFLFTNVPYYPQ